MKAVMGLMLLCNTLMGCDERVKTVDYYSRHLNEALALTDNCYNNIWWGDECINANEALIQAERLSLTDIRQK